jgi:uncharacterized protein (DUF927 family)
MAAEYAKFKMRYKSKISVRDLEKAIKQYAEKYGSKPDKEAAVLALDGIDLGAAVMPKKWTVNIECGVRRRLVTKDGESEVIACPDPVVITKRLVNIDNGRERLELSFFKDGRWKQVTGGRTHIYNKAGILSFGDEGLHVTTGTAADLVQYLSDYETYNKNAIPRNLSVSRLGWIDKTQFFPYSADGQICFEDDSGAGVVYANLTAKGDYAAWKDMLRTLRKNPFARFLTSAGFASPLLERIGVRTFVIHLWHASTSGKSAVLKAAISVWGNPLRIMGNGFTTIVGTEQLAGTLKHLPFGIDEKQSADERKLSLEHLIYVMGQGSGKIRGAKGGGNRETATWRNIVMLTGEEPVTKESSLDGIQTRTLELYGRPVDDINFAKDVHTFCEDNYGYAGAEFMKAVCERLRENAEYLKTEYGKIAGRFREKGMRGVHADYIAAVTLGDWLAERIIWNTDSETAMKKAFECGEYIFRNNTEQEQSDTAARAWDFVTGWLVSNDNRFAEDASPYYGKKGKRSGEYYVIPQYLDKALEDAKFNVAKAIQGFRERNYITTQRDSEGKIRTKTLTNVFGVNVRVYKFCIGAAPEGLKLL